MFCQWVNDNLLPNETLEPGFPRKISVETARKWMHELGFEVVTKKKGTFVDGHEREDVVQYRKTFLRKMAALGFLNEGNAPTEEARKALPTDLDPPRPCSRMYLVAFLFSASLFQTVPERWYFPCLLSGISPLSLKYALHSRTALSDFPIIIPDSSAALVSPSCKYFES